MIFQMTISDKFTWSRVACAPVAFCLYFLPKFFPQATQAATFALVPLLAFAELTDFFDGWTARKFNIVSDFGKIFDPLADVLLNLTLFFAFVLSGYMPPIIFLLILYREFLINFIRLMAIKRGVAMGARKGGKAKTCLYIASAFFSLFLESRSRLCPMDAALFASLKTVNVGFYCIALAASYISFADYALHFFKTIKER